MNLRFVSLFLIFLPAKNPQNFVSLWWALVFHLAVLATCAIFSESFCRTYTKFRVLFTSVHKLRSIFEWKIRKEKVTFQNVFAHSPASVNRGRFILSVCGSRMPTSSSYFLITDMLPKNTHFQYNVFALLNFIWFEPEPYIYSVDLITSLNFKPAPQKSTKNHTLDYACSTVCLHNTRSTAMHNIIHVHVHVNVWCTRNLRIVHVSTQNLLSHQK